MGVPLGVQAHMDIVSDPSVLRSLLSSPATWIELDVTTHPHRYLLSNGGCPIVASLVDSMVASGDLVEWQVMGVKRYRIANELEKEIAFRKKPVQEASPVPGMLDDLDLKALLVGDVNKLRYVRRFSTALVHHQENVAEHSYYVVAYTYFIGTWAQRRGAKLDMGEAMLRAMIHDMDEAKTGDFVRPFKHSDAVLKDTLEVHAKLQFYGLMHGLYPQDEETPTVLTKLWATAKDKTREGCLVALADYLAVLAHMWQELYCGNASMLSENDTMIAYVDTFDAPEFEFLRPVILKAKEFTHAVLGEKNPARAWEAIV